MGFSLQRSTALTANRTGDSAMAHRQKRPTAETALTRIVRSDTSYRMHSDDVERAYRRGCGQTSSLILDLLRDGATMSHIGMLHALLDRWRYEQPVKARDWYLREAEAYVRERMAPPKEGFLPRWWGWAAGRTVVASELAAEFPDVARSPVVMGRLLTGMMGRKIDGYTIERRWTKERNKGYGLAPPAPPC